MLSLNEIETFILKYIDGVKPPISDLDCYRRAIGADYFRYRINLSGVNKILKDAIIFVSDRPNYFFLRLSLSYRKKGIKTILLSRWGVEKEQEPFFDYIILYDSLLDLKYLETAANCLFYVQSWVGWNFLPLYIKQITGQKIACNINDLTHLLFDDERHLSLIGLSKEEAQVDLWCERYILENIPFVSLPYDLKILDSISLELKKRVGKSIFYFPCYPCPSFFSVPKKTGPSGSIHLLFVGGIPPDHKPDAVFKDAKIHDIADELLQGGFLLTILNNPQLSKNKKNMNEQYAHFIGLAEENKNFQFKSGYPPWSLKEYGSEYDYGLMLYSFSDVLISKKHYQNIIPTKFFTYLELSIPVIVIDEMIAVSEIVKQNGIGIVVSRNEIKNLYKILLNSKGKYGMFIDNIISYRKKHNLDKNIDQILANFF